MPARVHRQILAGQLPFLFLIFFAILLWFSHRFESALVSTNLETARRSSQVVVYAVQASMLSERSHAVWDHVVDKIPRDAGTDIEIVDARGRTLFSTDPLLIDRQRNLDDPLCAQCHKNGSLASSAETALVMDPDDQRYQIYGAPLRNTADCQPCHAGGPEKLGMVLVRQNLGPIQRQVRNVQLAFLFAGVLALGLTVLSTRFLLNRYLGRPLEKLMAGASAIGAGDLNHRVEIEGTTELRVLADTLNASSARLEEMVFRLRRQRDESRTLYRLVDQLSRSVQPRERRLRAVELAGMLFGTDCLLIRAPRQGGDLTVTFPNGGQIVEQALSEEAEATGLPLFYSAVLVRRWVQGDLGPEFEVRDHVRVAHALERSGRRLGLVIRPVRPAGSPRPEATQDPEMVQALIRHLAIALEFSELQEDLVEEARLAAIGETAAGLAHWLKNTLNGLRAGQYVIDRAVELGNPEKLEKGWAVMKKSVRRVEKLTADLLYCARERAPKLEPTDVNAVIRDVVEMIEERSAGKGVRLETELDERIGKHPFGSDAIHRVLLNLVTNAIDACTDSEHGDLVVVRSQAAPGAIVLTVEDNGIGISEAVRRNLFRRYFSTKGSEGTGLGLMVVKKIVDEHGGAVDAEPRAGGGSVFRLRFPIGPR